MTDQDDVFRRLCGTDWGAALDRELDLADRDRLERFLDEECARCEVRPSPDRIVRAFELTWCADTRVVIVGQDPYPGVGLADGLAFSVPCGEKVPGSLRNIFTRLPEGCCPSDGDLRAWAHQGVLLLNSTLTGCVEREHRHQTPWRPFIEAILRIVTCERDPVFLLWGRHAIDREPIIREAGGSPDRILTSSHPSPLSARQPCGAHPPFLETDPFVCANARLEHPIEWCSERHRNEGGGWR